MENLEILNEIGFTENEIKIYLALLKLNESTASKVGELANLNRVTSYSLLKSLIKKGFCSSFIKNNVKYFNPVSPQEIFRELEDKKLKFKLVIPFLENQKRCLGDKSKISLFEGKNGISSLFDLILGSVSSKKEIFAYGNFSIAEKILEYQSLSWRKKRIINKIKIKVIVDSFESSFYKQKDWDSLSEVYILDSLKELDSYVFITENLVAYLSFGEELVGILIEDKNIAKKENFNFNLIFNLSKRFIF